MEKDFTDVTLCYVRYYMGLKLNINFMSFFGIFFARLFNLSCFDSYIGRTA